MPEFTALKKKRLLLPRKKKKEKTKISFFKKTIYFLAISCH